MANEKLSEYQKFETLTISRSDLKAAPYNPRKLHPKARAKIKANIARVGLLEPPIWNKRTGNLVGGHQRLSILDSLHKSPDYALTVAVVDLTDKEEKEQNIFLNNGEAQGEWDLDAIEKMFREDHLSPDATGFDPASIIRLFGDNIHNESESAADLEAIAAAVDKAKAIRSEASKTKGDPFSDDVDYYLVLVGGNNAQRVAVTRALSLEDNRYQDIRIVGRLIGLARALGANEADIVEWVAGTNDDQCDPDMMDPEKAAFTYPDAQYDLGR